MGGQNSTSASAHDLYGGMSAANAGRYGRQFARPASMAFGWDAPDWFNGALSSKAAEGNPFAGYLQTTRGLFAPAQADAARAGSDIASRAPGLFASYMSEANGYLDRLHSMTQGAGDASGIARNALDQANSPIQSQALFQNALRESLASARTGAAGRGMLDSGSAQGTEDAMARDLAAQFAGNQQNQLQQALQGYQGALGTEATLGSQAAAIPQQQMQMLPAYAQLLQAGSQLPMQTAAQLQSFLASMQNPTLAMLQATAPQLAQSSKGWSFL